jgi:hypothetical protein
MSDSLQKEVELLRAQLKAERLQKAQILAKHEQEVARLKRQLDALESVHKGGVKQNVGSLQSQLADRGLVFVCKAGANHNSGFIQCNESDARLGRGAHGTTYCVRECGGFGEGIVRALKLVVISGRSQVIRRYCSSFACITTDNVLYVSANVAGSQIPKLVFVNF